MSRCAILCAGPVQEPAVLAAFLRPDDHIIAADGGCALAAQLGVQPHEIVADFDSAAPTAVPAGSRVIPLPVRKDVTDADAAAEHAYTAGYRELLLLGGTGGRLDHEYANLLLIVRLAQRGCRAVLADSRNRIEAVLHSPLRPEPLPGWQLSLFAFGAPVTGLTIRGAAYPLTDYTLQPADSLCVSNQASEQCEITFSSGTLLLFRSRD